MYTTPQNASYEPPMAAKVLGRHSTPPATHPQKNPLGPVEMSLFMKTLVCSVCQSFGCYPVGTDSTEASKSD